MSSLSLIDSLLAVALTSVNSALSSRSWLTLSKLPILSESSQVPGSPITLMSLLLEDSLIGTENILCQAGCSHWPVSLPPLGPQSLLRADLHHPHFKLRDLLQHPPHQAPDLHQARPPTAFQLCLRLPVPQFLSPLKSRQTSGSGRTACLSEDRSFRDISF